MRIAIFGKITGYRICGSSVINNLESYYIIIGILTGIILLLLVLSFAGRFRERKKILKENDKLKKNYENLQIEFTKLQAAEDTLNEKLEELKKSEEKNRKMASLDHITGLPNRAAFKEILDGVIKTLRKEEEFALMYIDLDNFKVINESFGHSYGDELLIDATDRIKQVMDENDYLACFGGDEFTVITQNIEDIGVYDEKLKKIQNVFSYPFILAAKEVFITVSIGVCMAPKDGKTTQILLKNLDSALYAAKTNGKNQYCYFNESINNDLMEKIELQSRLRMAIENQEFVVHYQPQVELEKGGIVGFEALIRWNHPTKGIVNPVDFIPIAEETGLIVSIGEFTLRQACRYLKRLEELGFGELVLSVNLSLRQFKDKELVHMVSDCVEKSKINPARLELEVTEEVALDNLTYSIETIQALKKMGIRFALDDFGTGYSSLNHLVILPINNLKIDNSFLDDLIENKVKQAIIAAIIEIAGALGIDVVAEGVESGYQEEFLKSVKCNRVQGFLYSQPITEESVEQLLELIKNGGKLDEFY